MTDKNLPGFRISRSIAPVTPVIVGTVQSIHACETPDGHVVVVWQDGGVNAYSAVLNSTDELSTYGVVTSLGQAATIGVADGGRSMSGVSVWVSGGVLRALCVMGHGKTQVFTANDVNNPTSWSAGTVVQNFGTSELFKDSLAWRTVGSITRMASGRLLVPMVYWFSGVFLQPAIGIWSSDDGGATWTGRFGPRGSDSNVGAVGQWMSHDIAMDAGGTLHFNIETQSSHDVTSTDGITWVEGGAAGYTASYSVEDSPSLWSIHQSVSDMNIYDATSDPSDPNNHVATGYGMATGVNSDEILAYGKSSVIGDYLYLFGSRVVGKVISGGWLVGQVGIG